MYDVHVLHQRAEQDIKSLAENPNWCMARSVLCPRTIHFFSKKKFFFFFFLHR